MSRMTANFAALSRLAVPILSTLSWHLPPHHNMSDIPTGMAADRPSSDLDAFCNILSASKCPGILTGAGLSAASGITTYRGTNGQWLTTVRPSNNACVTLDTYLSCLRIPWKLPLSKLSKIILAASGRTIIQNAISTCNMLSCSLWAHKVDVLTSPT